jgi:hypothetical protein
MEYWDWVLGIGLVAVAGYVRGFSGFGSAMVLTPGLSLIFSPQQAVATVILLEMVASIGLIPEAIPKTKWPEVLPMAIAAVMIVPVGAIFLSLLDPDLIQRIIGGLILGFVLLLLSGKHYQGQPHIVINFLVGALSGFLTGLIGIGGPPIVLYQLSGEDTAVENRANFISFFALTQIAALASYWINDLLTIAIFQRFLIFLPVSLFGLVLGKFSFKHVSESLFRKCILTMLIIIALLTLFL